MIYRSNLQAPDLQPYFKHTVCRVMGHSMGHDVLSDFADKPDGDRIFGPFKNCGFWTHDEAAILFNVAQAVGGTWLDIGGLTGWTACHLAAAGCRVYSVDPMYSHPGFRRRAEENISAAGFRDRVSLWACSSDQFFAKVSRQFDGIVIDGEHANSQPATDGMNAMPRVNEHGVVLFHDTRAYQIRKAYHAYGHAGWKTLPYRTPHGVALCYRDGLVPPAHVPDPSIP